MSCVTGYIYSLHSSTRALLSKSHDMSTMTAGPTVLQLIIRGPVMLSIEDRHEAVKARGGRLIRTCFKILYCASSTP